MERSSTGKRLKYRAEEGGGREGERERGLRRREGRKKPNSYEDNEEVNHKGREVNG